jgi:hypothetical protein
LTPNTFDTQDDGRSPVEMSSISPMSIVGQGWVDPFAKYPIKMNPGEKWLIDQGKCQNRLLGYGRVVRDSGHFTNVSCSVNTGGDLTFKELQEEMAFACRSRSCNISSVPRERFLNICRLRGSCHNDLIVIAHHSLAVRCVSSKLLDPVLRISDNVIASIVTFACYNVRLSSTLHTLFWLVIAAQVVTKTLSA